MLSGSWPGEIFLFRGREKGEFAAPEKVRHPDGKAVNFGAGIDAGRGGERFVFAGDAHYEETGKGTVIVYEGERFEVPAGKEPGITGTASAVAVADWDGDGDLDLVVGDIDGRVALVRNDGTPKAWSFARPVPLQAGGAEIRVAHDAGPCVADWDGDGLPDLLVGAMDGSVSWFRNGGSRKEPALAAARVLVPPSGADWREAPREPGRGHRAKVCAADWNGDGLLDLLLGDIAEEKPDLPEPSPGQKAEHARLGKELDAVRERYHELDRKSRELRRSGAKEELEKVRRELEAVGAKWSEIGGKLPPESEDHGWVWLFLRKAPPPAAPGGAGR